MSALPPQDLVDAILDAIYQSGETGFLLSSVRTHPREFAVPGPEGELSLWVYAWTATFGGRPQLPNEYRIQMTSVKSPLSLNPDGPTVLVGYEPNLKIFAGFDTALHRQFTSGSPSVQVDVRSLRRAYDDGLSFDRKDNNEITVGIRPDHFMLYVRNATSLHRNARQRKTLDLLSKASSRVALSDEEIAALSSKRRTLVHTISRVSRAANFRIQVLRAYGYSCAITRLQLDLIEAAHILPVAAPNSIDDVRNGIALSPTYHRAFDAGLIYMDEDYTMKVNTRRADRLRQLARVDGLTDFQSPLGRIHLPPDHHQWPNVTLIRRANKYRGIA